MSSFSYTKEQLTAINTDNCNILVSAAAGSGKTAVLVQRIVRKITDKQNPIDIDSLLVVTFTKAAASEMRQRISDALLKQITENPDNRQLQKQLTLLNKASITTIDAFCSSVVRKYYYLLDIDPSFKIADKAELELIKSDVIDEILEELYSAENNESFLELVEIFCSKTGDEELAELILNLHRFIQSTPAPYKWLQENTEKFNLYEKKITDTEWWNIIKNSCEQELKYSESLINKNYNIINNDAKISVSYLPVNDSDYEIIKKALYTLQNTPEKLYDLFNSFNFMRLPSLRKLDEAQEQIKTEFQSNRNAVKKIINDMQESIFSKPLDKQESEIKNIYKYMNTLTDIVIKFDKALLQRKKERLIADFSDISHYCLDILIDENMNPTNAAKEYQKKFNEIIIDEYQDSNYIQELILTAVSRECHNMPNRFMVGDLKQSIYKFRLANPNLFIEKYNTYSDDINSKFLKINLSQNFRSRNCVLSAVNFLFSQLMTPEIGDIKYDESAALYNGAVFPESKALNISESVEINIIDSAESNLNYENENSDSVNDLKNAELEASLVSANINKLMSDNFMIYDKDIKEYRKVEYRDIVILLRSVKQTAPVFAEFLSKNNIPSFADTSSGYFEYIEVMTILNLLKIIDNPKQEIELVSILTSPIYNLTYDEITEIKTSFSDKLTFYNCIKEYCLLKIKNKDIELKLRKFFDSLAHWKELSLNLAINELLTIIYDESNYYNYLGLIEGGELRQANLMYLYEKAIDFENSSLHGLFNFIKYINKLKNKSSNDFGEAKILSESENLVRIMSIHKSKGLEFPVVFVSMLGKRINNMDASKSLLLHNELGFGPKYTDYKMRYETDTIAKYSISKKIIQENLSEELRILYVALTRAKEKLVLTGTCDNYESSSEKWTSFLNLSSKELPAQYIIKSISMLDWIAAALSRHKSREKLYRDFNYTNTSGNYELYNDNSKWDINIITRDDIILAEKKNKENKTNILAVLENLDTNIDYSGYKNEINNILSWEYQNKIEQELPTNISITEIKRINNIIDFSESQELIAKESVFENPSFISLKNENTGASRGTAYHTLLEHLDLKLINSLDSLNNLIDDLLSKKILSINEINLIDKYKILKFVNSPLAERIRKSNYVKKETPFAMGLTPYEIYKDDKYKNCTNNILVHGIIDLYFEEESNIILVDYKTDYIRNNNINNIKEKYKIQLNLYKQALERNTGKTVSECILYLFHIDSAVKY